MENKQERSGSQVSNLAIEHFEDINSHKYIYMGFIGEPEDNSLRLVIEEAVTEASSTPINIGGLEMTDSRGIRVTKDSQVYEVVFDTYIGYSVIDESFALPNDEEVFDGRLFCVYEKSDYLDYLKKSSFACDDHPGPFKHYGFNCLNHIVNVASVDEPVIKLITR